MIKETKVIEFLVLAIMKNVATTTTESGRRKRTREDLNSIIEHQLGINGQNNPSKQKE